MRRLTVAVSGGPGTGKTTYAKYISERFNLRYISSGLLFRKLARELGVTLLELHRMAERDKKIDLEIDRRALEEARKGGVVVDGHLAVWVLKDVADIKILFVAPLNVRVERIAARDGKTLEEALAEVRAREASNKRRAKAYYGIDLDDWSVADLIVNTAKLDIEGVKKVVESFIQEYLRLNPDKA